MADAIPTSIASILTNAFAVTHLAITATLANVITVIDCRHRIATAIATVALCIDVLLAIEHRVDRHRVVRCPLSGQTQWENEHL